MTTFAEVTVTTIEIDDNYLYNTHNNILYYCTITTNCSHHASQVSMNTTKNKLKLVSKCKKKSL